MSVMDNLTTGWCDAWQRMKNSFICVGTKAEHGQREPTWIHSRVLFVQVDVAVDGEMKVLDEVAVE